jgi:hypothetical protein
MKSKLNSSNRLQSMKKLILTVVASSALATLTSCDNLRHVRAAQVTGTLSAGVELPPLPTQCRQRVPHAALREGDNAVSTLKRERAQLDVANGVIRLCAQNYDTVVEQFNRPAVQREQ